MVIELALNLSNTNPIFRSSLFEHTYLILLFLVGVRQEEQNIFQQDLY